MANAFKNATAAAIGTTATPVGFTTGVPDDSQVTCIGMTCANVSSEVISIDVTLEVYVSGSANTGITHLVKSAPIPVGGSLIVLGGEFKLVLQDTAGGNQILVKSNVASSVDAVMSYLEIT
jgi:hypothetical protein